jgi:uncharacterized Zn-binding protein involved in type VI secretion
MPKRRLSTRGNCRVSLNVSALSTILAMTSLGHGHAQTANGAAKESSQSLAPAGSATTIIQGKSAQRAGDATGPGAIISQGSPDVFIDGRPAAIAGSGCANGVSVGSSNVFINGKPAARVGDASVPCGK